MASLYPPKDCDYARLYGQPGEKNAIYITQGEAVRNGDDTGYIIFAQVWAMSAEYKGKDDATIEKYPYLFFELHDKPYEKYDFKTKEKQTIQPDATEVFYCDFIAGKTPYNTYSFLEGFKGKISFGDYSTLVDLLPDLPEEKLTTKLMEMIELEPVELSEEFKGKKKPVIATNGKGGGYRGTPAQKEAEKLADRASFIATFLNSESENGVFSESHQNAMALLYPISEDGAFKQQHYRNYLALILGGNSVL